MNRTKIIATGALFVVLLMSIGLNIYLLTREESPDVVIEYIKENPIHDTVNIPIPNIIRYDSIVYVDLPPEIIYVDTGGTQVIDTAALISEYLITRNYKINVFDVDTLGKLDIDLDVRYNELKRFDYTFIPVSRRSTVPSYKSYKWSVDANYYFLNDLSQGFMIDASRNFNRLSVRVGFMMDPKQIKMGAYAGIGINF